MEQEGQIKQLKTVSTEIIKQLIDPKFKISEGGATKKVLIKFLDLLSKEFGAITEGRIVDVCVYIAYIYRDHLLPVKSMFGSASLQRFLKSKRGQRFYENEWLSTKGLNRNSLISLIADRREHPQAEFIYMPCEEDRKLRLHNQKGGYLMCQASTLGWSPLSEACRNCIFEDDCKHETSRKYPELYRIRLEYGNRSNN